MDLGIMGKTTKSMGLLVAGLLWSIVSIAGEVTEQQALEKAQRFMQDKQFVTGKSLRRASQQDTEAPAFYIFNAENNGGFVIVSADDRTVEILGYSEQGGIDVNNMPNNLRQWLDGYAQEIKSLPSTAKATRRASVVREEIPVLIKSQWNQHEPYNLRTPTYTDGNGNTQHFVTGCVATAMAQLMYYHKHPESSPAIEGYTTQTLQLDRPALPATTFKWDKMQDWYSSYDYDEEAGNAVAELLVYCGQSVEMDYDVGGSGASSYNAAQRLSNTFGYSKAIREIYRSTYTTVEWENIIYSELSAQRPVMYSGGGIMGGHSFICDGYKDGMYHFNLGWGGQEDGYYVISAYSEIEFDQGQSAVIGIEPDKGQDVSPSLTAWMQYENDTFKRTSKDDNFSIQIHTWFYNYTSNYTGQRALALYHNGSLKKILETWSETITAGDQPYYQLTEIGGVTDGVYTLCGLFRKDDASEWQKCGGCELTLVIDGLNLTVSTDAKMDIVANTAEFQGKKYVNRNINLKMNITNNGNAKSQILTLYLDEMQVAQRGINIDPGTTEDVLIPFSPSYSGTLKVKVICENNTTDPLWQGTITITEAPAQSLQGSLAIEGEKNSLLAGDDLHATLTINNTGTNNYDDNIDVKLYNSITGKNVKEINFADVQISAGESKELHFDVTDLEEGSYILYIYYNNGQRNTMMMYKSFTSGYTPREYALTGSISGIKLKDGTLTVHIPVTNPEAYEYNDGFSAIFYRYNPEQNNYRPFAYLSSEIIIAAGSTETVVLTVNDIVENDKLLLNFSYTSNYDTKQVVHQLVTPVNTIDGDANGDGKTTITDAVAVVNCILGNSSEGFNTAVADVNGDGKITITDAVGVVNIILGAGSSSDIFIRQ